MNALKEVLKNTSAIYIAGASSRAKTFEGYVKYLFPKLIINGFLVDQLDGNDDAIDGIHVQSRHDLNNYDASLPVFIATRGVNFKSIEEDLCRLGFLTIIPVSPDVDNLLRNTYFERWFQDNKLVYKKLNELKVQAVNRDGLINKKAHLYVVQSSFDKRLEIDSLATKDYEMAIQAGAAISNKLTGLDLYDDNNADNISNKNRQFCELTAIYWLWKHSQDEYIGINHYRRRFIVPHNWLEVMVENCVDVVLPVPVLIKPSIAENYCSRHDENDWSILNKYLEDNEPEYVSTIKAVFNGNMFFPCNMFIARREVFNDLCSWLFPILFKMEEMCGKKNDTYQNRYIGFMSERLITLYFLKHWDQYSIVMTDKQFLK